jgi:hypothetical protein
MPAHHFIRKFTLAAGTALALAGGIMAASAPASAQPYGYGHGYGGRGGYERHYDGPRHFGPPQGHWRGDRGHWRGDRGHRYGHVQHCRIRPVWVRTPWGPERRMERICR